MSPKQIEAAAARTASPFAAALALAVLVATFQSGGAVEAPADPMLTPAPAGAYVADPAHTSVTWSLMHSGLSHWTARFVGVDANLDWRPEDPAASRLEVAIDPAGVRTDFPWPEETDFDAVIATDGQFLAGQPIGFVSREIEITGPDTGRVQGDLTMRGETHPAVLDVTLNGSMAEHPHSKEPKVGFSATAHFLRSDWGMDVLTPFIGDEITLVVETQMTPAPQD